MSNDEELSFDEILEALRTIMGKGKEEALAEAIETLRSIDRIMLFSEVDKKEIPSLTIMKIISNRYDLDWLNDYVDYDLMMRVSIKRKGRNELVKVISGIKRDIEERAKSLFQRIGGEK